jgi:hypothetical protein
MISPSDILVTVSKDPKAYDNHTVVTAQLIVTETAKVYDGWAEKPEVIDQTKSMVRHAVYQKLYGGLRDDIEEMFLLAGRYVPFGPEMVKFEASKKRVDGILGGGR